MLSLLNETLTQTDHIYNITFIEDRKNSACVIIL